MQVWDLFDEYTRDPHSERRVSEDGGLDSVKAQVVVDINGPQEEGEDAMVLFESHLACIAVCTLNLSIGSTSNVQPNKLPELNPFPASLTSNFV